MLTPFGCWFTKINECGIHGSEVMVCIYGVILTAQFFALMNPGINAVSDSSIAIICKGGVFISCLAIS